MKASLLVQSQNTIAESPCWHANRKSLFWIDTKNKTVHEFNWTAGQTKIWKLKFFVSHVFETTVDNELLLAVQSGLVLLDLTTGNTTSLINFEKKNQQQLSNDGACDVTGRVWIGTMDANFREGMGTLYSFNKEEGLKKRIENVSVPNGIVWSLDNKKMYFIDSPKQQVESYLFDSATGEIEFDKIVVRIEKKNGTPDGMCIDEEGMLWIAQWDGFGVYRYNPSNGALLSRIDLPVQQVSSCAFGGLNSDCLFITTGRDNLSPEALLKYPLSGNIFLAKPGIRSGYHPYKFPSL